MLSFASDYIAGAHPSVMKRLMDTNLENLSGYGTDEYCRSAADKIKNACGCPQADVFFLVGGTQTNQIVIDTMLKPFEGVIAARTGHVSIHESGAIEYTGHKVLELDGECGKLKAADVDDYVRSYNKDENRGFMVAPGMVYISFPTEYGTIYSKAELKSISEVCHNHGLLLFIDGARMGYGLAGDGNDVSLRDIARLCDVFYIGGTKVGALCGEAVVFTHHNMPENFSSQVKRHGALLAKGRLLGVQFDALFTDDLYMDISCHAIDMAHRLKKIFADKGYSFFLDSPTNQQFVILDDNRMKKLGENVSFGFWEKIDDKNTVVRFATSWSTSGDDIEALSRFL